MILNISTEKYYIGRAFNLDMRWRTHKSALNKNKHTNEYLQFAWNKYGESDFKFFILETIIDKNKIIQREQHWIDILQACNREKGFNLNPSAANSIGYKHTEDAKAKIKANSLRLGLKPPSASGKQFAKNINKWPHGCKCKCDDCKKIRRELHLKWLHKKYPPRYLSYPEFAHLK